MKELRKMTVPKLREVAKQVTDLQGVVGMEKEQLIEAIAKAQGISYQAPPKDATIGSLKQEIRALKKQKDELFAASSRDRIKIERVRRKIKRLKRTTRKLAAARPKAPKPEAAPAGGAPAAQT